MKKPGLNTHSLVLNCAKPAGLMEAELRSPPRETLAPPIAWVRAVCTGLYSEKRNASVASWAETLVMESRTNPANKEYRMFMRLNIFFATGFASCIRYCCNRANGYN